jgi:hypothetical protein
MTSLVDEEVRAKRIVSNQLILLFTTMLLSMLFLLYSDSLDFNSKSVKLVVYVMLSFSAVSFTSAIYGVYRIIYNDARRYSPSGRVEV